MKKLLFCCILLYFSFGLVACVKTEENRGNSESIMPENVDITDEESEEEDIEKYVKDGETDNSKQYANWLEELCKRTEFDTKEDIINNLETGNGYALIDVYGSDDPAVMITSMTYNDNGINASIMAYLYLENENGR